MIKTGVIGYGLSGRAFHAPLIEFADGLELTAIASRQREEVNKRYPKVRVCTTDELIATSEIELVVITSPNHTHYSLAKRALENGKHVVLEKPMVMSVTEGEELIALAKSCNRLLSVYHNRRWDSDFLTIKTLLEGQSLGELHTYKAHFHRYQLQARVEWKTQKESGGTLYDLGSHLVDQALTLFGWPEKISSDLQTRHGRNKANDYFVIKLYYPGLIAELSCDMLTAHAGPKFELHGSQASYFKSGSDIQENQLKAGMSPDEEGYGLDSVAGELYLPESSHPELITHQAGCYSKYYEGVADAIANNAPLPVTAAQGLDVIRLLSLCEQYVGKGIIDININN